MPKKTTTQLTRALKVLPRKQLVAFFTAKHEGNVLALKLIRKSLAKGQTLEEIFATSDTTSSEPLLNTELKVERSKPGSYRITVGFFGSDVGDGGVYRVAFTANGDIKKVEPEEFWIC